MPPPSDEELFERFRARGDAEALGELFDRTAAGLLRLALHLARDPATAEDLVQATFVKAIEARAQWDGRRPVLPWLCGILNNQARSARRSAGRGPEPASLLPRPPVDPAKVAEASEFDAAVDAAIAALPECYQPVLRLHLAYGHEPAEIAHALARPPGTVRSQLARGLELLRKSLPAGLTAGIAGALLPGSGLAAVRTAVVAKAAAAVAAAPLVGTLLAGAIFMKSALVSVALLVAAVAVWLSWTSPASGVASDGRNTDPAPGTSVSTPAALAPAAVGRADTQRSPVPAPSEPTTGALRITCRHAEDRSPASEVLLVATPLGTQDGALLEATATTDAVGVALVAGLPPGKTEVAAERGGKLAAEVVAGKTGDVELIVPAGVRVRGRVVDAQGAPVPSARVWLSSERRNVADGRQVCAVDAAGRFELRSVEPERFLSAVAPGYRAAVLQPVKGTTGSSAEVVLELQANGASLLGRVIGPDGVLVVGASVFVGYRGHRFASDPRDYAGSRPCQALRSDGRGEFRVDGLLPGSQAGLWVRAPGTCTAYEKVDVAPEAETRITVRLSRGAVLTGRATDAAGKPVAGATISALSSAWSTGVVKPNFDDFFFPEWMPTRASTGAAGEYRIEGLSPGTLYLQARNKTRILRAELPAEDEREARWDPTLTECTFVGRVLDERGVPLPGIMVMGSPPRSQGEFFGVTTDAQGRFRSPACNDVPYRLDVHEVGDCGRGFTLRGVRPGTAEVLVRLPDALREVATVEGTLLDCDGRPVEGGTARIASPGLSWQPTAKADPKSGRFRFPRLSPGTYRLQGEVKERRASWGVPFTLLANEAREVGVVQMPVPGSIAVEARGPDGKPLEGVGVVLVESYGFGEAPWSKGTMHEGRLRIADVAPGRYRVRVQALGIPTVDEEVVVVSEKESSVAIAVPAGKACRLLLSAATEPLPIDLAFVWVRDGKPESRYVNSWEIEGERPWPVLRLLPGTHELTITSETGKREVNRFVVAESDPEGREIRIKLP